AGFVMHNLATFGQSYPKPDLTHLPPKEVVEIGELWAVVAGAARAIRHGCAILTGLLKAKAVLVYPIFKPWNLTAAYKEFSVAGDPIQWPYAETLDGGKILVQPMLLEGAALKQRVQEASAVGFDARSNAQYLRFANPFPMGHLAARRARDIAASIPNIQTHITEAAMPPELIYAEHSARNAGGRKTYVLNPSELNDRAKTGYDRSGYGQTIEAESAVG
ncbi:MAG TPA: hypothetical protein VMB26_09405, partial [Candidatus Binataceae bacterium]|nr:hypothetical protein [Candidatus Binataceae bacterium]